LRTLEVERIWGWRSLAVAAALLVGWAGWFLFAEVPLYETSASARVEAAGAAHRVDARTTGRAVRVGMIVGARVRAGDILVELDGEAERLAIGEARARLEALQPDIDGVRREIAAEERAIVDEHRAAAAAGDEQRANVRDAQAALDLAREEAARITKLRAKGVIPELEDAKARTDVERKRASAEAAAAALARIQQDQHTRESDRRVRIQRLRSTEGQLEGETRTTTATIKRLENEVERRLVRAPIGGRIAEAADLRVGTVVHEGESVASIVPEGALRVVAQFTPASAIGRVRAGQTGRVRLHGFPWTEYGTLHVTVTAVADEVRDGLVRVELAVDKPSASLPMSHALPGNVEIEVERVRPVSLVLRTLGRSLTRPVAAAPFHDPAASQRTTDSSPFRPTGAT
jgi:membrane fusion protein (multidrug efflux system)